MSQDIGSGGARVAAWRAFQADQAFQSLEGEFDTPAQAIEGEDVLGGVGFWQRRDEDHPVGGDKGGLGDLMSATLGLAARIAAGGFGGLFGFPGGDEAEGEGRFALAGERDGSVDDRKEVGSGTPIPPGAGS